MNDITNVIWICARLGLIAMAIQTSPDIIRSRLPRTQIPLIRVVPNRARAVIIAVIEVNRNLRNIRVVKGNHTSILMAIRTPCSGRVIPLIGIRQIRLHIPDAMYLLLLSIGGRISVTISAIKVVRIRTAHRMNLGREAEQSSVTRSANRVKTAAKQRARLC